jgi:hypothetical protein
MKSFPAKAGTTITDSIIAKSRPLSPIRNEKVRTEPPVQHELYHTESRKLVIAVDDFPGPSRPQSRTIDNILATVLFTTPVVTNSKHEMSPESRLRSGVGLEV